MIREIFEYKHNIITRNKRAVRECEPLLIPGTYQSSLSGDIVYLQSEQIPCDLVTFDKASSSKNRWLSAIKSHISQKSKYCVSKGRKIFQGNLLLVSSSGREYKVFDDKDARLITVYLDEEKLKSVKMKHDYFSKYFNTIPYYPKSPFPQSIEEPMIKKVKFHPKDAFWEVLSDYNDYLRQVTIINDTTLISKEEIQKFEGLFHKTIDSHILNLPLVYSHGDLWSENLIFDGDKYYYLDFEHASTQYFLYDIFMFMFTEAFMRKEYCMLQNYLKGLYDKEFTRLFRAVGCSYDISKRKEYFKLYIAIIYNLRWKDIKSPTIRIRIRKIMNLCGF